MSRPPREVQAACSAASTAAELTACTAARALCHVTSGSAPLIHSQASCWAAGTRCPSAPAIGVNGARSAGAADGATSRHASAPKAITRFTPPADTSGVRGRRKAPTASAAVNPRSEVELEEMVRVGALREDPELRQREGHVQLLATWLRRPYARACASPIALDDARDRLQ